VVSGEVLALVFDGSHLGVLDLAFGVACDLAFHLGFDEDSLLDL